MDTSTSDSRTTGQLVAEVSEQTASLVRQEIRLAQAEMKQKGKGLGTGAGMLGGSGLLALYGLAVLVAAAVLGLATALDAWLAALIVGAALLVVAGVVALVGKKQVGEAVPPTPDRAMHSVEEDIAAVRRKA